MDNTGIFYLLWPSSYARQNKNIYKIGISTQSDKFSRLNNYEKNSELIKYYHIKNVKQNENKIIKLFTIQYPIINNDDKKGNEYFQGNLYEIINDTYNIICDDILEIYNFDNDLLNGNFRKLNIYYDEYINSKYYHFIKMLKSSFNNSYEFRTIYFRFILDEYIDLILVKKNLLEEIKNKINDKKLIENIETNEQIINSISLFTLENNESTRLTKNESDEELITSKQEHKIYICHHCMTYCTYHRRDIVRHFDRKNKCKCNTLISYDQCKILSCQKIFIFDFNYLLLLNNDIIFIVNNYVEKINYIHKNFMDIDIKINKNMNNNMNNNNKNRNRKNIDNKKCDEFTKLYFNEDKQLYICDKCSSRYTTKYNLIKHKNNVKSCDYKKNVMDLISETKKENN